MSPRLIKGASVSAIRDNLVDGENPPSSLVAAVERATRRPGSATGLTSGENGACQKSRVLLVLLMLLVVLSNRGRAEVQTSPVSQGSGRSGRLFQQVSHQLPTYPLKGDGMRRKGMLREAEVNKTVRYRAGAENPSQYVAVSRG